MANNKQAAVAEARINVPVPRGLRLRVVTKAKREGTTMGAVVVALLKGYVG